MSLAEPRETNSCLTELIHMKNPPLKSSRLSNFDSALQLNGLGFTCFNFEPHRQSSGCRLQRIAWLLNYVFVLEDGSRRALAKRSMV